MAAFFNISFLLSQLGVLTPQRPEVLLCGGELLLGNAIALLFLEVQAPLAQLVYPNAQFPRHLGLGLISNGSQPHRFKLELPGMVPAFLAFHDTALLRRLCLYGTVHETWVTSRAPVNEPRLNGRSRGVAAIEARRTGIDGTRSGSRCVRAVGDRRRQSFSGGRLHSATEFEGRLDAPEMLPWCRRCQCR